MAHGARLLGPWSFLRRVGAGLALVGTSALPVCADTAGAATAKPTGSFAAITCPTATSCFAAGSYGDARHKYVQPMVGRWTANKWVLARAPIPGPANPQTTRGSLSGVACATAKRCFAVGAFDLDYGAGIHRRTLIEQWTGTHWSIASRIRPAGAYRSALLDVDCPSATLCFAVGQWENVDGITDVLITQWNGKTWSILENPHIPYKVHQSRLTSISCATPSSCVAVGTYQLPRQLGQTLTEHWDGTRWRWVSSPNAPKPMNFYDVLTGVSCTSTTSCLAVGSQQDGIYEGTYATLSLRWTGFRWVMVPTPKHTTYSTYYMNGVACPATDLCFAVGMTSTYDPNSYQTTKRAHVERWDGNKWSIVATALPSTAPLDAIACRGRRDCRAVGGVSAPVVAHWNGTAWSSTTVPVTLGPA